ncbi:MAG: extracellular solute-binding protein [Clostridiales bacterium]|jgi:multiple sugar transport system substrate-binding protein/putative aldouronate transport system substrate-binding protein|nr:extracellular solute-binding protein [Clostridiales bacterium]
MKKFLGMAAVVSLLLTSVAGCGSSGSQGVATDAPVSSSSESAKTDTTEAESAVEAQPAGDLAFRKFDAPLDVHIGMSVSPTDSTLPSGDTAQDNQYTRYLRDNYNINVIVDWTAADGNDYNQKVSLAIASDSLPDGLVSKNESYMKKAAKSNMLYDITDLFQQYASEQVKGIMDSTDGRAMESVSYNGRMIALPNITVDTDGVHILFARKDWLDKYNLGIPKTLDDVEAAARVFKQEKPAGDATVPLTGPDKNGRLYCTFLESSNNQHGFDPVFGAYDAYPGYWLDNGDGTISYGTLSDNTRSALERLASWYKEGIIDPEMGTRDSSGELVNANQVGLYFGPWWSLGYGNNDSFVNDPTANYQAYPIFDSEGQWNTHMKAVGTESCLISAKASEDTAAALIIMYNALVRDEGIFDTSVAIGWYPLRVVAAPADECEYEAVELTKVLKGEADPEDYSDPMLIYKNLYQDALVVKSVIPGFEEGRDLNIGDFNQEDRGKFNRMYAIFVGDRPFTQTKIDKAVYSVTYSLTDTMEKKWSNLKKMEDETMLKIITGQADVSAFDQFKTDWLAQGGQEILDELAGLQE